MVWALTGFMGCGKSTIGRLAASLTRIQFVDLDDKIILREGRSIPEIFAAVGEAGFRDIERDTLADILSSSGVRFAHPTIPSGRSPRYRTAGVTSLRGEYINQLAESHLLLSLGGGTLTDEGSRALVRDHCKCIYLRASVETLAENLRIDDIAGRPMLAGVDTEAPASAPNSLESYIAAMMAKRAPIYEAAADISLDIDGLSYEEAAQLVLNSLSL